MELHTQSGDDLYGYLGVPVKLELNVNEQPICGNIYTIDPETHSVVLMQFENTSSEKPNKLIWIPGSTIKLMHELNDDELLSGCVACSSKHLEYIEDIVRKSIAGPERPAEDDAVTEERLKRLTNYLKSKNTPFSVSSEQVIKIGPVDIERPYFEENIRSKNLIALARTKKLLAEFLK